ncbi:MAG TPA: hypothetical protein VNN73_18960 [Blastocatellia bacterium]|nr:hypothetical protein [Blastocatellia bacterium]
MTRALSVYDQGYTKGYGEGYAQGQSDWQQGAPRDFQASDAFQRREQSYDQRYATSADYTQGFELGFELGYLDGYYGRPRNAVVPANGAVIARASVLADQQRARQTTDTYPRRDTAPPPPQRDTAQTRGRYSTDIPANTLLNLKLNSTIDTKNNRVGDRFTATVIAPPEYEGATVEGHIARINKSGRVSGRTELALAFDTITFQDGRQAEFSASLEKVVESETVKKVDEEGNVQSGSRTSDSKTRGGVGAAAGAIIGGIAGGAKGAILGAIIGGAAGVGTVYVEGDKDLILEPGTEMIIRTERGRVR